MMAGGAQSNIARAVVVCPDGATSADLSRIQEYFEEQPDCLVGEVIFFDKQHYPSNMEIENVVCRLLGYAADLEGGFLIVAWPWEEGENGRSPVQTGLPRSARNVRRCVPDLLNFLGMMTGIPRYSWDGAERWESNVTILSHRTADVLAAMDITVTPTPWSTDAQSLWARLAGSFGLECRTDNRDFIFPSADLSDLSKPESSAGGVATILVIDDEWGDYNLGFLAYRNLILRFLMDTHPDMRWVILGTHLPDDIYEFHRHVPVDMLLVDISFGTIARQLRASSTFVMKNYDLAGFEAVDALKNTMRSGMWKLSRPQLGIVTGYMATAVLSEQPTERFRVQVESAFTNGGAQSKTAVDCYCPKPPDRKSLSPSFQEFFRNLGALLAGRSALAVDAPKTEIGRALLGNRFHGIPLRDTMGGKHELHHFPADELELLKANAEVLRKMWDRADSASPPLGEGVSDPSQAALKTDACISLIEEDPTYSLEIAGEQLKAFPNRFWVAATPVSGSSTADMTQGLASKVLFLLRTGFGGVIVKTIYYPEEKDRSREPPRTRAYLHGGNLYNMGHTPNESIGLGDLRRFKDLLNEGGLPEADFNRVILSFGVKSHQIDFWKRVFDKLSDVDPPSHSERGNPLFPIIEINARHSFREMSGFMPGQELLDEYAISPDPVSTWTALFRWLDLINRLGCEHGRKIIVKLPFRSDLIRVCGHIHKLCKDNRKFGSDEASVSGRAAYGIVGVTLINTIKSPYTHLGRRGLWKPEDRMKVQQLSGGALRPLRDWALFAVRSSYEGLFISASGGIMTGEDARGATRLGADTLQIGTAMLVGGLHAARKITRGCSEQREGRADNHPPHYGYYYDGVMSKRVKSQFPVRKVVFNQHLCGKCGRCLDTHYCDAFVNKYNNLDNYYPYVREVEGCCPLKPGCTAEALCPFGALSRDENGNLKFDESECQLCFDCVEGCTCKGKDKKLRFKSREYPEYLPQNCTGCGLCVQVCPGGALQIRYFYFEEDISDWVQEFGKSESKEKLRKLSNRSGLVTFDLDNAKLVLNGVMADRKGLKEELMALVDRPPERQDQKNRWDALVTRLYTQSCYWKEGE